MSKDKEPPLPWPINWCASLDNWLRNLGPSSKMHVVQIKCRYTHETRVSFGPYHSEDKARIVQKKLNAVIDQGLVYTDIFTV